MKHFLLFAILFLFTTSCSENFVNPQYEDDDFNLNEEAANFPWDLVSGKIAYNRFGAGVILVDGDTREMKRLKGLPYLDLLTWHHSGTKITGVDLGYTPIWGGGESRPSSFYCIDLEGNYSSTQYSPRWLHSWSNDGSVAVVLSFPASNNVLINEQLFLSSSDYSFRVTRPAWSADSKYLVTSISGNISEGTYAQIKKFDVTTKIGTTLVVADSVGYKFRFEDPIYSPDGNKIAYAHTIRYPYQEISANQEIWIMDSDGLNNRRLTSGHYDSFPAWAPDGTKLIFQRNTDGDHLRESEGIFLINGDGTGLQKVLSEGSEMPIWK